MGLGINAVTQNVTRSDSEQSLPAVGQTFTLTTSAGATPAVAATAAAGTNSASTTIPLTGATSKSYVAITTGAVTTGVLQMQGSNDGVVWTSTGGVLTLTGAASGAVITVQNDTQSWRFYRVTVTTTLVGAGGANVYVVV